MIRKLIIIVYLLLGATALMAQYVVADSNSKEPLPYATIVFPQYRQGVYTDSYGRFVLPSQYTAKDSLSVQMLGYHTKNVLIAELNDTVYLEEKAYELPSLTVRPQDRKTITIGELKAKSKGNFGVDTIFIPVIIAIHIPNENHEDCYIEKLHFKYSPQNKGFSYMVRPQLYEVGSDGKPANSLLNKSSAKTLSEKGGILEIDVSGEFIVFPKNGVFVGLEIIEEIKTNKKIKTDIPKIAISVIPLIANTRKITTCASRLNNIEWTIVFNVPEFGPLTAPFGLSLQCPK